ncbi:uncharacterized protein FFB14_12992 [Fusarium fujikuroi]|nr:uncharacterized protein FFB14_12992 [Fusarium fujikuroi]
MPLSVAGAVAALALPLATTTMEMTPVKYRGRTVPSGPENNQEFLGVVTTKSVPFISRTPRLYQPEAKPDKSVTAPTSAEHPSYLNSNSTTSPKPIGLGQSAPIS